MNHHDGVAWDGTLSGENLAILEGLAYQHLFGLALALKKGRCNKLLKELSAGVQEVLSKGPLKAYGAVDMGYGAIKRLIGRVRAGLQSRRGSQKTREYRHAVYTYTHTASFFWYQLQHLTDIPEYRDDAVMRAEQEIQKLIEVEP